MKTGEWLAIWNEVEKGFLIHFDRNMGVELGWPDSQRWEDQLADLVWEESKKAAVDYLKSYAAGGGSVDVDRGLRVRLRHRAVMTRI